MDKLVCANCGSDKVESLAWVDSNTHKYKDLYGDDGDEDANWCNECEDHVEIIYESTYQIQ